MDPVQRIGARYHIQHPDADSTYEPHWGYAERVLPCTNDIGSCQYLDAVYGAHDRGMIYTAILWATILGVVFVWAVGRRAWPSPKADTVVPGSEESAAAVKTPNSTSLRLKRTIASFSRRYLLPDATRAIFGRTTRLQVLVLSILAGYLLIWTHVGITYERWITPVKDHDGLFNVRSGLGPWSDRIGVLAYALTPLSVLLASRESLLSLLTGVPYQSFNFLHRWLGYIIVVQGTLHTISWTIIEVKLYQPQPETAEAWIKQLYMIWGVVAQILLLLIFGLSTPWGIRLTGYEFFRKAHYVLAMVYIGACWGHWKQLRCFMLPSLIIWFLDRGARLIRTALIHHQCLPKKSLGFKTVEGRLTHFPDIEHGDVVRLDFENSQDGWSIGKHFYLCFPEGSIWQSHPFTPLNLPVVRNGTVAHSYIFRAKKGETKKIAELTTKKLSASKDATTPVILQGPYGESIADDLTPDVNVLCVAGGTGLTYVLPVLLDLAQRSVSKDRKIELVWAVRRKADVRWVEKELGILRKAAKTHRIALHIFVTREGSSTAALVGDQGVEKEAAVQEVKGSSSSISSAEGAKSVSSLDVQKIGGEGYDRHPDLRKLVNGFVESTVRGPTVVYASGPGGMISDLRSIVAACNSGSKVWRGNERFDVRLTCDDRLEW